MNSKVKFILFLIIVFILVGTTVFAIYRSSESYRKKKEAETDCSVSYTEDSAAAYEINCD